MNRREAAPASVKIEASALLATAFTALSKPWDARGWLVAAFRRIERETPASLGGGSMPQYRRQPAIAISDCMLEEAIAQAA
jgi:hypothetical protein